MNILTKLYLGKNKLEIIEGLDNLAKLKILDFRGNPLKRISGLENLSNLYEIKLDPINIPYILRDQGRNGKVYANYCQKNYVVYNNNPFFVEKADSSFRNIKNILIIDFVKINKISHVHNLKNLNHLEGLNLSGLGITELEGLNTLRSLKLLWLAGNKIEEIKGLGSLHLLEDLSLYDNKIEVMTGLETLVNLKKINLDKNYITKITGVNNLKNLEKFSLKDNERLENIEEIKHLTNLKELNLSGNEKISDFSSIQFLAQLKYLYLNDCQIENIEFLANLKDLEVLELRNNKINELKTLKELIKLKVLNLANNNIRNLYSISELKALKSLTLDNNKIINIHGLGKLINLKKISIEGNFIDERLFKNLKLHNLRPNLFTSYCILKPRIENLKNKIPWSDLIEEEPYLKLLSYDQLRQILSSIENIEVKRENGKITSIETFEFIAQEFNNYIRPFPPHKEIKYAQIATNLNIKNEKIAEKLLKHIFEKDLYDYPLYLTENGVSKEGHKLLKYQLAIFDVPNQKAFFKRGLYEYRLKEIEKYFMTQRDTKTHIIKIAFIKIDDLKDIPAGLNYLDKNLSWTLITNFKEKETDIDTKIGSVTMQLSNLYPTDWEKIFVISSDSDIVSYFLDTFDRTCSTELFFITDIDNNNLDQQINLNKKTDNIFDMNIYIREN